MTNTHQDFVEMLLSFNEENVEYIVVGAHALAAHGFPRATKDLDIWVHPTPDNAPCVIRALDKFGAPLNGVSARDFAEPGIVFQIGVAPVRIDLLTEPDGVEFEGCYERALRTKLGGVPTRVLSREDLIANKRASGRPQDLVDIATLQAG